MPTLHLDITDGVATLTMDEPAARNALTAEMAARFAEVVPQLRADTAVRAILLTGANHTFSAGGDIRGMREFHANQGTVEVGRARMQSLHPWVRGLLEMDKPVIAAVEGAAYGAGFSLALLADFILAAQSARFCLSFMRIGLVPDVAAMYTLPRVVGVQRAKELMLSAREVDATEAKQLGIVLDVVAAEQLMPRAQQLARSLTQASPLAVALVKQQVGAALAHDAATLLDREADHQGMCMVSAPHKEAVRRFLGKEPPAYQWPQG